MLLNIGNNGKYAAKGVVCFLLGLFSLAAKTQNLVPNPSFELNDTCPYTIGFVDNSKPLFWEKWNQSPEYFHACAGALGGIDTLLEVPRNGFGFQYPFDGDAYVGISAYGMDNYRENVGCQLLEPLEVGEIYDLSFYTNVAGGESYYSVRWACNNMGMLFTMEPDFRVSNGIPIFPLRNYAHLRSSDVIADSVNWTLVSGSFVADSAYQYLVLGNFFSNALTDTIHLSSGSSFGAYYFVDGVCVTRAGQDCSIVNGVVEQEAIESILWPNPTNDWLNVPTNSNESWKVYDAVGSLIRSGFESANLLQIHVGDLAEGEYALRLEGTTTRRHFRFVVIK